MKCTYCGAEAPASVKFCRCCGTRLTQEAQPEKNAWTLPTDVPAAPEACAEIPEVMTPSAPWQIPETVPVPSEAADAPVASAPAEAATRTRTLPRIQLPTRRSLAKMFFLGILTLGIYPTVIYSRIVTELNIVASRYDGKRTVPYFGALLLMPLTLMIYGFVWCHCLCDRIGAELRRRGLPYAFGAGDFWLWNILGALILVGPFIFMHRLMKAMNYLNRDFNAAG